MNNSASMTKPGISAHAGSQSSRVATAPDITVKSVMDPKMGHGLPWGI